ncbi:hypothetical protein B7494_g3873 [Chlorociboria aeruginascens]|nr:hypothetical protein B7494_g3873 [Chlorociboria aeruginascens]
MVEPLAPQPFVSIRKSIKWGNAPARENSITLVLTSASKYYVDVRIYKPLFLHEPPLPNNPSDPHAMERLEWAFAGTSESHPGILREGKIIKPAHTIWHHWVDSKTKDDVRDEGYMYPEEGSNEVLEKGNMVNPATGKAEDYEEIWEDLEVGLVGDEDEHVHWVLRTRLEHTIFGTTRGMVIRVGEWIQGVLRVGDEISVVRWKWDKGTGWARIVAIKELGLEIAEIHGEIYLDDILEGSETYMGSHSKAPVTLIPSMIDASCGTSPAHYREAPLRLLLNDLRILGQNLRCLPQMMRSMCSMRVVSEMFRTWKDTRDILLQCKGDEMRVDDFADERWIFINGSMTSNHQLHTQLSTLYALFCRPMIGIHNPTYGLTIDILSHLLTHLLPNSSTQSALYTNLREHLLNPSIRKVVVLAHGTGASILSCTLDRLHANLPPSYIDKIEIYTFGSAASHLNNPQLDNVAERIAKKDGIAPLNRMEDCERVIPHIEHYALQYDLLACNGILHHTRSVLDTRFCGRVFVLSPPSTHQGFLFSTHYLSLLFPDRTRTSYASKTRVPGTKTTLEIELLDEVIDVDIETAEKREFTAQRMSIPLKRLSLPSQRQYSPLPVVNDEVSEKGFKTIKVSKESRASWNGLGTGMISGIGVDGVSKAREAAREAQGKTLRQVSRLWRYAGGGRPTGEGVAILNGVGN